METGPGVALGTTVIGSALGTILSIYLIVLIARLVIDYVMMFARDWQPKGPVLILVEAIFTVTDPPLRAIRKVIPPIRLGGISLDIAFLVLLIGIQILINVVSRF
ncbi:MAG: YggT family protein [Actinomycetes bacterium]|jgi:YggT family protein